MLDLIGLDELSDRMPHELSGGQQQRVQLARSLVLETDILLLDEPLAALDAKLRKEMCIELKRLQETVGITFVHVTHNQEEAMTVADDLAVIAGGELVEVGRARALYENPQKRFTADFIGENNMFDGRVTAVYGERVQVDVGFATIVARRRENSVETGDRVALSIRSELVHIHAAAETVDDTSIQVLDGEFQRTVYLGLTISDLVRLPNGQEVLARRLTDSNPRAAAPAPGDKLRIGWRMDDVRLHVE